MPTRNPSWARDELILALDLYFRHNPNTIRSSHPEVQKVSNILNALPIHKDRPDAARFRNPNGVYTKLCNFLRLDPTYHGAGLKHGGAGDKEVWEEFAGDRNELARVAAAIRARVDGASKPPAAERGSNNGAEPDEDEFPEGKVLFRAHRARERNRQLVEQVKRRALRTQGSLACQACGFEFKERYGELGEGYIECHHVVPISQLSPEAKTKVSDIALLCSNCHRMVHRRRPWLSMAELKSLLSASR